MHKKCTGILLVVVLLLLTLVMAHAQESDFLGIWYLVYQETDGSAIDFANVTGASPSMTLMEDGKVEVALSGYVHDSGTWSILDGKAIVKMEGHMMLCALEGNWLVCTRDKITQRYGREPVMEPTMSGDAIQSAFEVMKALEEEMELSLQAAFDSMCGLNPTPPFREDAAFEDFIGSWKGTHCITDSTVISLETAGAEFNITVTGDGEVYYALQYDDGLDGHSCEMRGHILIIIEDVFSAAVFPVALVEDGTLFMAMSEEVFLLLDRVQ